jgi:mRNA interferase MazF
MRHGKMLNPGDVILTEVKFTDTFEMKLRPAVLLFEDMGNIVIAGITSNVKMKGVTLTKKDGAIKESVIKTNYIFTVSENAIRKKLFSLSKEKKKELYKQLIINLSELTN